ncbi:MAG: DUF3365 domain-containing protein [Verrucomicrobiales bacterium]|nr:DUF3365 domain-containing protein [Verrucomicrobiales bacterium]
MTPPPHHRRGQPRPTEGSPFQQLRPSILPSHAALSLVLAGSLLLGCDVSSPPPTSAATVAAPVAPSPAPSTDPRETGKQIVAQAFSVLSSNLMTAIGRSGPSNALEFCSVNVAPIVATVANARGAEIRRASHKARNPANQASAAELEWIRNYQSQLAVTTNLVPLVVTNAAGRAEFVAPIILGNPLCLQCHGQPGSDIHPATLAVIDRLYPSDAARGFKLGDLRGLWRVTLPAP